jgi:hypothetical protein
MLRHLISDAMLCLLASASGFVPRAAPGVDEGFGLCAYGESVGGLSLFCADGNIFLAIYLVYQLELC